MRSDRLCIRSTSNSWLSQAFNMGYRQQPTSGEEAQSERETDTERANRHLLRTSILDTPPYTHTYMCPYTLTHSPCASFPASIYRYPCSAPQLGSLWGKEGFPARDRSALSSTYSHDSKHAARSTPLPQLVSWMPTGGRDGDGWEGTGPLIPTTHTPFRPSRPRPCRSALSQSLAVVRPVGPARDPSCIRACPA